MSTTYEVVLDGRVVQGGFASATEAIVWAFARGLFTAQWRVAGGAPERERAPNATTQPPG